MSRNSARSSIGLVFVHTSELAVPVKLPTPRGARWIDLHFKYISVMDLARYLVAGSESVK